MNSTSAAYGERRPSAGAEEAVVVAPPVATVVRDGQRKESCVRRRVRGVKGREGAGGRDGGGGVTHWAA